MPDVILTTLNTRYAHAAFGLRYLLANMGDLRDRSAIVEFDINQRPTDLVEMLLAQNPRIIGVGVYIWNVEPATRVVAELKRVRPDITIVLGGPEVSYETDHQEIVRWADYVITGEADIAFGELCAAIFANRRPLNKIIAATLPEFSQLVLPYELYDDRDVAHRVIYVEASRGCPFKCEFCLSSLDVPVRNVPIDAFLAEMGKLFDRGVRQFKFVDRTFNLNLNVGRAILQFFLGRDEPGLFLHFEMIPDRLPEGLRELIRQFPAGSLQFEVGIQTFNDEVSKRISRRQDNARVEENFKFLRGETGVHIHADLIAGLPGETLESFAAGFDRLVALRPHEIQLGILKRLRGTPIIRHDGEWGMVYSPHAPYEILQTNHMDFPTMQAMRRTARFWDLIANSGNFVATTPMVWGDGSPFWSFWKLSEYLFSRFARQHAIALPALAEAVFHSLTIETRRDAATVAETMWADYQRGHRGDRPEFLRPFISDDRLPRRADMVKPKMKRQARHAAQ